MSYVFSEDTRGIERTGLTGQPNPPRHRPRRASGTRTGVPARSCSCHKIATDADTPNGTSPITLSWAFAALAKRRSTGRL